MCKISKQHEHSSEGHAGKTSPDGKTLTWVGQALSFSHSASKRNERSLCPPISLAAEYQIPPPTASEMTIRSPNLRSPNEANMTTL